MSYGHKHKETGIAQAIDRWAWIRVCSSLETRVYQQMNWPMIERGVPSIMRSSDLIFLESNDDTINRPKYLGWLDKFH